MYSPTRLLTALTFGALLLFPKPLPAQLRAGAATADTTPVEFPVSSNGGMRDRFVDSASDPLHARSIVLENGETKIALCIVDLCMIPDGVVHAARKLAHKATGIPEKNILIAATHTHTAPSATPVFQSDTQENYLPHLSKQIAQSIIDAHANLEPAEAGFGSHHVPQHVHNRRWLVADGESYANPFGITTERAWMNPGFKNKKITKPAGPIDPEVAILAIRSPDGRPIAILANYSLHYVGNVPKLSADYFGQYANLAKSILAPNKAKKQPEDIPPFVAILSNGTSGDINNIDFSLPSAQRKAPYEQARLVAKDVALTSAKAWEKIEFSPDLELAALTTTLDLGVRKADETELARARKLLETPPPKGGYIRKEEIYARESVLLDEYPDKVTVEVMAIRIGDISIAAAPCEIFVEIGLELKDRSPFDHHFTISLANGYHGYLPTPEQHTLGGYETWRARSSYLETEASPKIVEAQISLLKTLHPSAPTPWKKHTIQSPALQMINSAVANDWDRDSHIDVLSSFEGKVILFKGPDWKPHPVFSFAPGNSRNKPRGGCIHSCLMDVDGDGDLDFVGSNNTVFWLECPDNPFADKEWIYRNVDDEILGTHCLITGDVNKDGRLDLIANSGKNTEQTELPHSLTWLEAPENPLAAKSWKRHVFADKDAPGGSHYAGFGDVNKDGRPDIAYGAKGGKGFDDGEWFAWWEQPEDPTGVWKKHLLSDKQPGATNIIPEDFDKDGHVDYFATRGHGTGALLFKGPDFKPVEIDTEIASPHSLALADIDGDGDTDAVTCGKEADGVAAWYQNDGSANFTKHVIGTDQGSYDTRTVDMDADGDLDVLIAGHSSRNIVWFENPNKPPTPPKPKPLPKSPEDSLASIHVPKGYKIELVVAEPKIMDPVAIDWDTRGRLWVCEMADYPLGLDDKGKPGGRIRILEDADRDGTYEKNTIFLDGLIYPKGLKTWRNGVLITAAPDVIYAEDTDGDDKADTVETWFTGFAKGNQQLRVNGLRWSVDGWLHLANGKSGGTIYATDKPDQKIDIRNYDVRIRPDTREIEATTGRTQFGISFDNFGQRFGCDNSYLAWHVVLEERHLRRNSHVTYPPAINQLVPQRNPPVYPKSKLKKRIHADFMANRFTSACGLCIYRDELIPTPKRNSGTASTAFICEPVHNTVTRRHITRSAFDLTYEAGRAPSEMNSEFIASEDNWFRPVMARTGPGGALWIVDMYRDIVEHPHWVPKEIRATWEKNADLRAGHDRGRIYRIVSNHIRQVTLPSGSRMFTKDLREIPDFTKLDTARLVALLGSKNGTVRDIAQQQLMWHESEESEKLIRASLADPDKPAIARLHALGCLSHAPTSSDLSHAAKSGDPALVALAFRLTESLPEDESFPAALAEIANPSSILIASSYIDAVTALGAPRWAPHHGKILGKFAGAIVENLPDVEYRIAALCTALPSNLEPIGAALAIANFPHPHLVANTLITADKLDNLDAVQTLAQRVVAPSGSGRFHPWQFQAAAAFGKPLPGSDRLLEAASKIAVDNANLPKDRAAAISLLGTSGENTDHLVALLGKILTGAKSGEAEIANAALEALTRKSNPGVPDVLISAWIRLSPSQRSQAINFLLRRTPSAKQLLTAIKVKKVTAAEIDTARRKRLLSHKDESVRTTAKSLFQNPDLDRAKVVAAHRDALDLEADPKRGKEIFALHCAICHQLDGVGNAIGPDLRSVTDRSPVGLLTSILDPSAQMEPIYQGYICETIGGDFHTGLVVGESGGGVEIVGMDAQRHAIPGSDIKSLKGTGKSFMPEGLETAMSKQDLADLIHYLGYPD